jgi:hypothetical protein
MVQSLHYFSQPFSGQFCECDRSKCSCANSAHGKCYCEKCICDEGYAHTPNRDQICDCSTSKVHLSIMNYEIALGLTLPFLIHNFQGWVHERRERVWGWGTWEMWVQQVCLQARLHWKVLRRLSGSPIKHENAWPVSIKTIKITTFSRVANAWNPLSSAQLQNSTERMSTLPRTTILAGASMGLRPNSESRSTQPTVSSIHVNNNSALDKWPLNLELLLNNPTFLTYL